MARFSRTHPAPTVKGDYTAFRPYVRKDFEQCCAYCCLHEFHAHGEKNFQLDHFCPRHECPDRVNDFYNLYWSCSVCNGLQSKSNHWPSATLLAKGIGFVDLCKDNFKQHYALMLDGRLEPLTGSARYTIKWLNLNSDHLIKYRASLLKEGKEFDKEPV